ncbi:MAG: hypothetical protein ACP5N5_06120 [Desulfurococcus sp.]|uniref:hypothetical protein n=1 Tax=Desulfurococcus sp. TaxID=51678 RepID=UPI003D096682
MLSPSDEKIVSKALEIVERANSRKIVLRIIGAVGIYLHIRDVPEALNFYINTPRLGKVSSIFTDIDLVAYSKQRKDVMRFFEKELKYSSNPRLQMIFGGKRLLYFEPQEGFKVDIFFDKLEFSHDVLFGSEPGKGRLELDYPTTTPTDLLLEKLQIHKINFKDIVDVMALLLSHEVKEHHEANVIDAKYIASVLSDDWGFWYDAMENLKLVEQYAQSFFDKGVLSRDQLQAIKIKISRIREIVDATPKTKNWVKRAKDGTKKPWYREVEEYI